MMEIELKKEKEKSERLLKALEDVNKEFMSLESESNKVDRTIS
jgi:hypothetical protein